MNITLSRIARIEFRLFSGELNRRGPLGALYYLEDLAGRPVGQMELQAAHIGHLVRRPAYLFIKMQDVGIVPRSGEPVETGAALKLLVDWLCRAQDAAQGGGVSTDHSYKYGWLPPYPETSGYRRYRLWTA